MMGAAWRISFAATVTAIAMASPEGEPKPNPANSSPVCGGALTPDQKQALTTYVRKKFKVPANVSVALAKEAYVGKTCFRELVFQGKSDLRSWDLPLYATPDLRFLASDIFDTQRNPDEEERARNEELMSGLTQSAIAARGSDKAPVTLVAFSDFQCPFCSKFAAALDEAIGEADPSVRVVFRHFPLPGHDWARAAAEGAACAQLQTPGAFWAFHNQLFKRQASITAENVRSTLDDIAKGTGGLDLDDFQKCMKNGMSLGVVLRDMRLAETSKVNSTPTFFINGQPHNGVENAKRLRELISEARREAETKTVKQADSADLPGVQSPVGRDPRQ